MVMQIGVSLEETYAEHRDRLTRRAVTFGPAIDSAASVHRHISSAWCMPLSWL